MALDSSQNNNKRLAKNTILLYIRMAILMLVSLYTSRVILNALGVNDYGIYNVVGGFVALSSIVTGSLSAACSRFITFSLGRDNKEEQNKIFSMSMIIMMGLSLIITIVLEIVGLWFLTEKLNIPVERIDAAHWVFQCSVVSFVVNLLCMPYNACIIAHEKMSVFAYITILDATFKLGIAWGLLITPIDKLVTYAILYLCVSIVIQFIYILYCKKNFQECKLVIVYDKRLASEMFGFAGWSFVGCSAQVLLTQGVNIITNLFFTVASNAARGVASQLEGAVRQLVNNFMMALNPQITKSYAAGEHDYTLKLVYQGAKYSFFLSLFFAVPFFFEMDYILCLWLKNYPAEAPTFARLTIAIVLADVLSLPIITANAASGKVKKYQLVVGGYNMMIFPIVYICFLAGLPAYSAYIVHFIVFFTNIFVRIRLMRGILPITYSGYIRNVLFKVVPVFIISMILPYLVHIYYDEGLIRLASIVSATVVELPFLVFYLGLRQSERVRIIEIAKNKLLKR